MLSQTGLGCNMLQRKCLIGIHAFPLVYAHFEDASHIWKCHSCVHLATMTYYDSLPTLHWQTETHRRAGLPDGGRLAADHERLHLAHQVVHLRHHQLAAQHRLRPVRVSESGKTHHLDQ